MVQHTEFKNHCLCSGRICKSSSKSNYLSWGVLRDFHFLGHAKHTMTISLCPSRGWD